MAGWIITEVGASGGPPRFQLGTTYGPKGVCEAENQGHFRGLDPVLVSQGNQPSLNSAKKWEP